MSVLENMDIKSIENLSVNVNIKMYIFLKIIMYKIVHSYFPFLLKVSEIGILSFKR